MNKTLFFSTLRRSSRLIIIFTCLLLFYMLTTMGTYPGDGGEDPFAALPDGMKEALGISGAYEGLTGFMAVSFYGMTFVMFLMIYCVLLANQLISSLVDRGSMAYLLTTPVSRRKIAVTQASVLIGSLLLMTTLVFLAGWAAGEVMYEGAVFSLAAFIKMNVVGFLLFFVISGYSFFFSCRLNESKHTLAATGLLSVLFYFLHIVSNMSAEMDWLRFTTILSVFQPVDIVQGASIWPVSLGLLIAGLGFYVWGVTTFSKRDLPL
jgi:ABC-2 type transport system permease protein